MFSCASAHDELSAWSAAGTISFAPRTRSFSAPESRRMQGLVHLRARLHLCGLGPCRSAHYKALPRRRKISASWREAAGLSPQPRTQTSQRDTSPALQLGKHWAHHAHLSNPRQVPVALDLVRLQLALAEQLICPSHVLACDKWRHEALSCHPSFGSGLGATFALWSSALDGSPYPSGAGGFE